MVYFDTSEEWQRQSSLLLQARPTTTRVTTKYKIPNLNDPKYQQQQQKKRKRDAESEEKDGNAPKVPRAVLVLKTYDPESGVVLKFKTDRHAEVGRLFAGLGRLGRYMAALPEKADAHGTHMEDVTVPDADIPQGTSVSKSVNGSAPDTKSQAQPAPPSGGAAAGSGGGGGGKKKKKGKK